MVSKPQNFLKDKNVSRSFKVVFNIMKLKMTHGYVDYFKLNTDYIFAPSLGDSPELLKLLLSFLINIIDGAST